VLLFIIFPGILGCLSRTQTTNWVCSLVPCTFRIIGLVLRSLCSLVFDISLLPAALVLLIIAKIWKSNFDPTPDKVKKGIVPILLIHGNDFNETEWVIGRLFLKSVQYGSVYSLNYDQLIRHDQSKGPDDYARNEIHIKIEEILLQTKSNQIILIGHSMGGLIAGDYAEYVSPKSVKHIITISTPWQGAPIIQVVKYLPCFSSKRYQQMLPNSAYLKELNDSVRRSIDEGKHQYYTICSTVDPFVPNQRGLIDSRARDKIFSFLGHYGPMVWPGTWLKIRQWLDIIYSCQSEDSILNNVPTRISLLD